MCSISVLDINVTDIKGLQQSKHKPCKIHWPTCFGPIGLQGNAPTCHCSSHKGTWNARQYNRTAALVAAMWLRMRPREVCCAADAPASTLPAASLPGQAQLFALQLRLHSLELAPGIEKASFACSASCMSSTASVCVILLKSSGSASCSGAPVALCGLCFSMLLGHTIDTSDRHASELSRLRLIHFKLYSEAVRAPVWTCLHCECCDLTHHCQLKACQLDPVTNAAGCGSTMYERRVAAAVTSAVQASLSLALPLVFSELT